MKEKIENWLKNKLGTYTFLFLLITIIFLVPLIGRSLQDTVYRILITGIYFGVVVQAPKHWRTLLWVAIISTIISWVAEISNMIFLRNLSETINLLLFGFGVVYILKEIAGKKQVTTTVILDAISGYLLLGLFFTIVIGLVHHAYPASISFPDPANCNLSDYNYFSFITLSTLGYGDITPQTSATRSLAMLTCVTGQLYLTIVVALLVGKLSS